ncbi:hypothetical protein [Saccharibacillus sp. O23]|uniref:hypothetical protein n=1 Tax=Saccharibacillus sp. O23 TaxID=2009338 RepID=UPI00117B8445|nr:hypothetical protein [Saccharibacillus sp. O23]
MYGKHPAGWKTLGSASFGSPDRPDFAAPALLYRKKRSVFAAESILSLLPLFVGRASSSSPSFGVRSVAPVRISVLTPFRSVPDNRAGCKRSCSLFRFGFIGSLFGPFPFSRFSCSPLPLPLFRSSGSAPSIFALRLSRFVFVRSELSTISAFRALPGFQFETTFLRNPVFHDIAFWPVHSFETPIYSQLDFKHVMNNI